MNPIDPNAALPGDGAPKPWHRPQPQPADDGNSDGGSAAGNIVEGAAEVTSGALEVVGGAVDVAGGCLDGCSGCSLAVLVMLAAAGSAMAFFG